jgi:hypothetical protein
LLNYRPRRREDGRNPYPAPGAAGRERVVAHLDRDTQLQSGRFIEETIRSVLLHGYPDLEYIIIDCGWCDQSVEIIKNMSPGWPIGSARETVASRTPLI